MPVASVLFIPFSIKEEESHVRNITPSHFWGSLYKGSEREGKRKGKGKGRGWVREKRKGELLEGP